MSLPPPDLPQPRLPAPPVSPTPNVVPLPPGAMAPPPRPRGPVCSLCGQAPAAAASFNAHTGMVFMWKRSVASGLFCRSCGIGVFRKQMNHTLAFGWFGLIAFFANFYAIVKNLANRATVRRLAPPPIERPQVEGRPLFARFGVYVGLALVAVVAAIGVVAATTSEAEGLSGDCLEITRTEVREVSCSDEHDGRVIEVVDVEGTGRCPDEADDVIVLDADESHALCVDYDA